jgi:hypothetical protein
MLLANAPAAGYTSGQLYTISRTCSFADICWYQFLSNASSSLAKTGDIITLSFTASEPINPPQVTIATHAVSSSNVSGNNYSATYTMTASDVQGLVPFTINFTNTTWNEWYTGYNNNKWQFGNF